MKRQDYISWDEYFLEFPTTCSLSKSKDQTRRLELCIVDSNVILSWLQRFPVGCSDDRGTELVVPSTLRCSCRVKQSLIQEVNL